MDNLKYLTKEQLLERYSELRQEYIDLQNENESLNDYISELEYSNDNSDLGIADLIDVNNAIFDLKLFKDKLEFYDLKTDKLFDFIDLYMKLYNKEEYQWKK